MNQKEKLEQRRKILDDYEVSIGLSKNVPPGEEFELQQYLDMSRDEIERLDASTAIAISGRLSQFAFYFQRTINREKSNKTWADAELASVVCKEILQYDKYTPNKVDLVCRENIAARELKNIAVYAQQRINRLEDLASALKNLSYTFGLVAKNRIGER